MAFANNCTHGIWILPFVTKFTDRSLFHPKYLICMSHIIPAGNILVLPLVIYFYSSYSATCYSDLCEYWFVQCNGFIFRAINWVIQVNCHVCTEHNICLPNAESHAEWWKMSKYEISQLTENTNISAGLNLPWNNLQYWYISNLEWMMLSKDWGPRQ